MYLGVHLKGCGTSVHIRFPVPLTTHSIPVTSRSLTMLSAAILALSALAAAAPAPAIPGHYAARQQGQTMLRFGCPQVVIDRLDPLVNPGAIPVRNIYSVS